MRITRRQLRMLIKESCGLETGDAEVVEEVPALDPASVPVPQDYDAVRNMLEQSPEIVNMAIAHVMDLAGTQCERSTAQGIIDHLQQMVTVPEVVEPDIVEPDIALPAGLSGMIKGPGFA